MAIFLSWLANRRLPLLDVMQNFASQGNIFRQAICTNKVRTKAINRPRSMETHSHSSVCV